MQQMRGRDATGAKGCMSARDAILNKVRGALQAPGDDDAARAARSPSG